MEDAQLVQFLKTDEDLREDIPDVGLLKVLPLFLEVEYLLQ